MTVNFHKLYFKFSVFCLLNILVVGIFGSVITKWNVDSFVHYVTTKGVNTRLRWIKKIVTNEAVKPNTKNGVLDIVALNQYLLELVKDRGLEGLWITDGNGQLLAGLQPKHFEDKNLVRNGSKGFSFINYYLAQTLISSKPLSIALPGNKDASIHLLVSPELPDRLKKNMMHMLGLGLIGLLVNSLLIYLLVAWFIIKPIRRIRIELNKIAEGNLSHRVAIMDKGEIGELVIDINDMANMTEKLFSSTQELATSLSHEIRTPLSQIRIASDILRLRIGEAGNQQIESKFVSIEQDIEKIDRLIDQVLVFSNYNARTDLSKSEPVQFVPILTSVLKGLKSQIKYKNLDIQTQWSAKTISFVATPADINLICSNLLSNAVKYSPKNGIIQINLKENKDAIFISIANTCEPMTDEEISHVFKPFNRNQNSKEMGTNLGLTITRKIVDKYKGSISATSCWKDTGFCMDIVLPIPVINTKQNKILNSF